MSRSPQGLSFFKKRLCAIGWVVFFPFFFPHVPPLLSLPPKSLHQSYCGQCWERTAFKKKKIRLSWSCFGPAPGSTCQPT